MTKHVDLLNGLIYFIRITPLRGWRGAHLGELVDKDTDEVVFESDFPCYKDAYQALMEMDGNSWLGATESPA